jgi:hypothetical protein
VQDGWRLALANLAVYSLFLIIGFLIIVFLSVLAGILLGTSGYDPEALGDPTEIFQSLSALSSSGGGVVLYVMLFGAAAMLIWLALRLTLFGISTVATNKVVIFRSWSWTKGHALRLFIISLVTLLAPFLIGQILFTDLAEAYGFTTLFSPQSAINDEPNDNFNFRLLFSFTEILIMAPYILIGHGMAASIYRQIAPQDVDVGETVG